MNRGNTKYEQVIKALRSLPRGFTLRWYDPCIREDGLIDSWVDVYSPEICDPLNLVYAWSVNAIGKLNPRSMVIKAQPTTQVQIQPLASYQMGPVIKNAWTPQDVTEALQDWIKKHAGVDLNVEWDPSIGISPLLRKLLQDPNSGTVQMGKSVSSSPAYLDVFIQRQLDQGIYEKRIEDEQRGLE